MLQYAARLPIDEGNVPMQEYPAPIKALVVTSSDNASASSVLTLTDDTTVVEVAATGGAAGIRWVPATETAGVAPAGSVITAAGTANFDHIVPSNSFRRFVVPRETQGVASIVGSNVQNGLYKRIAIKGVGVSSIAAIQF